MGGLLRGISQQMNKRIEYVDLSIKQAFTWRTTRYSKNEDGMVGILRDLSIFQAFTFEILYTHITQAHH